MRWATTKRAAFAAAEEGNAERVRELVEQSPKLLDYFDGNRSLLHAAVEGGSIDLLALLTEAGIDINATSPEHSFTPLQVAGRHGSLEVIAWLLDHGAEIDAGSGLSATALTCAAAEGRADVVEFLILRGADVDAAYSIGGQRMNAIGLAEMKGHSEVAELIRRSGASPPDATVSCHSGDEIEAFLCSEWGPISQTLGNVVPAEPEFVLHAIRNDTELVLVTSGVSDRPIAGDSQLHKYAELVMILPPDWLLDAQALREDNNYWPIRWLMWLAGSTVLTANQILPNGDPAKPLARTTEMSSLLLLERASLDTKAGKTIDFYAVVPIYEEEKELAEGEGVLALLHAFARYDVPVTLDPKRANVGCGGSGFGRGIRDDAGDDEE